MKPTENQFTAYQQAFNYFNERLFDNKLKDCILNFSRKSKAHGFYSPERWNNKEEKTADEISLNPDTLEREPEIVFSTLVHEQCHLWQHHNGEKQSKNGYHNKEFSEKMESVGLITSSTGSDGGKRTGQKMTHYIDKDGAFQKAFNEMPKKYLLPWKSCNNKKAKRQQKTKLNILAFPVKQTFGGNLD